ncbi:MAG: amidohydrolase family protein [Gammaproteobacteria bacterium]|nr:amidohydrolase family protein [Gammaproteobacteria bacterium]
MKKITVSALTSAFATTIFSSLTFAAEDEVLPQVLFKDVHVWDGLSDGVTKKINVLIEGNKVKKLRATDADAHADARVIDGAGRILMPGLIDMHTHTGLKRGVPETETHWDGQAVGAMAHETMMDYINMGFTTLRDICAGSLGVARATAAGVLSGPRLYSGGPCIGASSGHSDWGPVTNLPGQQSNHERIGNVVIADGPQAVADAARQNFRGGATVLKVFVGGGVASQYDPLEAVTYTQEEIAAAVEIANDFKSYVCIHAYNSEAVDRALDAGVRCVEHAFLVNEETVKRMKRDGIVLSAQAFMSYVAFEDPAGIPGFSAESIRKGLQVHKGADQMFKWAAKHELEMFAGSDMFTYDLIPQATQNLVTLERWFTPLQVLKMGTSNAGKWLMKTGPKNPWKEAQLGTLIEGSYADVILVNGNPLDGVSVLADYENNIPFVMGNGRIYKNEL